MKLTRFEVAGTLRARALQISLGAPSLVDAGLYANSLAISRLEREQGVLSVAVAGG